MPLAPGQVLNNRYRVVKLLGQGGFGAVYRAWDVNLNRPYAVKENLDASAESGAADDQVSEALRIFNPHHFAAERRCSAPKPLALTRSRANSTAGETRMSRASILAATATMCMLRM